MTRAARRDGFAALSHPGQIRDAAPPKLLNVTYDLKPPPMSSLTQLVYRVDEPPSAASSCIAHEDATIVPTLVHAASGVVLEPGPGPGNLIHRYDTSSVKHIYAVEPNPHFRDVTNASLDKRGLRDRYMLIACGVKDSDVLSRGNYGGEFVYNVMYLRSTCHRYPNNVIKEAWKLLTPRGKFIFWEHGCSRNRLTSVAQGMPFFTNLLPFWVVISRFLSPVERSTNKKAS